MRYAVRSWLALVALLCTIAASAAANESELYRTTVFVTGRGEAERLRGTDLAFQDVLVKVSGDPRLARDPRAAEIAKEASALVVSYDYRDRMQGLALHDEQGTRDRPYDLTVHFDPTKIDAALASLGSTPWTGLRPRLAVFLAIQDQQTRYVLAQDGARGLSQRQAFAAAAAKRALPMALPTEALLEAERLTYDALAAKAPPALAPAAKTAGGGRRSPARSSGRIQRLAGTQAGRWRRREGTTAGRERRLLRRRFPQRGRRRSRDSLGSRRARLRQTYSRRHFTEQPMLAYCAAGARPISAIATMASKSSRAPPGTRWRLRTG
jgi:uncharacterized protein